MKLHIKNYQRLEDLTIELKPGINLISGSSNNGKSSTIRAVRDFIFNKISKDKIRHGQDEVIVELDTAKAVRDKKGVIYEIDGNTFEKVGRNILPEIKDKFNIDELVINGVAIKPNFWFQMDKPFLIDKTAGQKHDLLIGTKNDKYIKALKNIKSEQLELSKVTKKYLEEVIDSLKKNNMIRKEKLERLNGIEELVNKINVFEKQKDAFDKALKHYNDLRSYNETIKKSKNKIELINSLKTGYIYDLNSKVLEQRTFMELKYDEYKKYRDSLSSMNYLKEKINKFAKIFENTELINELSSELSLKKTEYIDIDNSINNYEQAVIDEERQEKLFNQKLDELNKTIKEFEDFKQELGLCPLCGGDITVNNFL